MYILWLLWLEIIYGWLPFFGSNETTNKVCNCCVVKSLILDCTALRAEFTDTICCHWLFVCLPFSFWSDKSFWYGQSLSYIQRLVSQLASMASSHQITQAGGATAQLLALIHTTPAPLITSKSIQFRTFWSQSKAFFMIRCMLSVESGSEMFGALKVTILCQICWTFST